MYCNKGSAFVLRTALPFVVVSYRACSVELVIPKYSKNCNGVKFATPGGNGADLPINGPLEESTTAEGNVPVMLMAWSPFQSGGS